MPATRVSKHNRKRDGKVVQVSEHARELGPKKATDSTGVARGPSADMLGSMEDVNFQEIENRLTVLERGKRPWDAEGVMKRRTLQPGQSIEVAFMGVVVPGEDNFGNSRSDGFAFVNESEPLGRETSLAFLKNKLAEQFGDDATINMANVTYDRYDKKGTGPPEWNDSHLPEWLKEEDEPRVPTEDVLSAANYFAQKTRGTPLQGKTVVLSGEFPDMNREDAELFIETLGAKVAAKISKKVDVLIADPNSTTSKVKKAKDLGIQIVLPAEVVEYPEENLAAWRTELYRRYRIGTKFSYGEKYSSGPSYEKLHKPSKQDAKTHEEALALAETKLQCVHQWAAPTVTQDRNPVLGTGGTISSKQCIRCGKQETRTQRKSNWSGD